MQPNRPLLARLNWYWICQIVGWNAIALMNLMFYSQPRATWPIAGMCWWAAAMGLLLSDGWHRILKRRTQRRLRIDWKLMAPAQLVLAALHTALSRLGITQIMPHEMSKGWGWLPSTLVYWTLVHTVWTILYSSVLAARRASRFEAEALRLEIHAKDAELRALQAQVNPHFFFNSLNSVRGLIYENQNAAAQMIDQLASLMRYALQSGHNETVPLADEMEAVHAYLAIEKIRFEERMQISVEIAPGLERVRIPPMALQTLVENAVKYGVEASATGSEIRIRAQRAADGLIHIEIANLGAIIPFANSTKVGLVNTRKRLALALGAAAHLDLRENSGWVRATLTLPEAA